MPDFYPRLLYAWHGARGWAETGASGRSPDTEYEEGSMADIIGFDHVGITVADPDASCRFYRDVLGGKLIDGQAGGGDVAVRRLAVGGVLLSIRRAGGVNPVAQRPTIGAVEVCFRWGGSIESAVSLLREHGVEVVEGPTPGRTADGLPSHSVFFRDPDGNLLELMAADPGHASSARPAKAALLAARDPSKGAPLSVRWSARDASG